MNFFYHGAAGAADFYFLCAVCVLAAWRGPGQVRVMAGSVAGAFLGDRLSMLASDDRILLLSASSGEFAAMCVVLKFSSGKVSRAVAALFAIDLAALFMLAADLIGFESMAAITTVALWLQLLLVISTVNWHGLWEIWTGDHHRRAARSGADLFVEGWLEASGYPRLPHRTMEERARLAPADSRVNGDGSL